MNKRIKLIAIMGFSCAAALLALGAVALADEIPSKSPTTIPRRSVESILAEIGSVPRAEHPRPDRVRPHWRNLNGIWEFAFDPENVGLGEQWNDGRRLADRIVVPFCPESLLSGIHETGFHPVCWYAATFDRPKEFGTGRVLLHFGAVDYRADVWVNGRHLGQHQGGYDGFAFEVGEILKPSGNRLTVRVEDDPTEVKPQGKQSAKLHPGGTRYMRVTGIWQTVWLESVGTTFIRNWQLRTDPETGRLQIDAQCDGPAAELQLEVHVGREGKTESRATSPLDSASARVQLVATVPNAKAWSPEEPALYDLELRLSTPDGTIADQVTSYFGFRSVEIRDGAYLLNGKPIFFASALDQGYYPTGLYTAPTDAALLEDVQWAKRYGLNGIRKHQIVAEPRYYYWCDRLGLLVWGEMADWGGDATSPEFARQWQACLMQMVNHPSIITWVPTNEWRHPEDDRVSQAKVRLYEMTKALDPTRPVIDTSGYCHTKTDITDLHVNPPDGAACRQWWIDWQKSINATGNFPAYPDLPAYAKGFRHENQPVIISETGNWRIADLPPAGPWKPYGYGPVPTAKAYLYLYRDFFSALIAEPKCVGFCYVQLYDVEGEVNGYLTYDRKPKVPPEAIRDIHVTAQSARGR